MNLKNHLGLFSWAVAAKLLPLVYGLVLILVVIPELSRAEFGRFNIIFSAFNLVALLNRSIFLHPMLRFGSDPERFKRVTRIGLHLSVIFYVICGFIVWNISPLLARIQRLETGDFRLVAVLMAVFFFREYGFFVAQIRYRTRLIFLIEAVFFLGSSLGFIYLAAGGALHDARDVLLVMMIAAAASSLTAISTGAVRRHLFRGWDRRTVGELLRYGLYTLPTGLAGSLLATADKLVLGAIYTPVEVGVYSGAKEIYRVASALTQAAGLLITPYAARLSAGKRSGELRELFEKGIGYVILGLTAVAATGWLLADSFYTYFLAGAYLDSAPLLRILLFAAPFEGVFNVAGGILYGMGFAGMVSMVSAGTLGLLLLAIFPAVYLFGGTGCALSVVAALSLGGTWMFFAASRRLGSSPGRVIRRLMVNLGALLHRGNGA